MKTLVLMALVAAPFAAQAQMETCDRFSFAVSSSRLNEMPVTVLRGGMSPVIEIAGKPYNYDVATHCMAESGKKADCSKPLKVMDGKKVVALIEGQGRVLISPTDGKGKRDFTQPHYEVSVERDPTNSARPLFVIEAMGADGKALGRVDGIEGMTAPSLQAFKGKLASAHRLIDLRGKSLVYANCRKLAVMHMNESPERAIASARSTEAPVKTPPVMNGPTVLKLNATSSASEGVPNPSKPTRR